MKQNNIQIPEGYKNSSLGIIPNDWEVKRLEKFFSFKNGINASKKDYGQGVKFVNTMDVLNNQFITADKLPGSVTITKKQEVDFILTYGDVLFNRTSETRNEVGCSSVFLDTKAAVFGGFIIRAQSLNKQICAEYKKYCFKATYFRDQVTAFGNGAIRYNLGQEDLSKVLLTLPPLPQQQKIAEILGTWDEAIEKQSTLIDKLTERKHGLMQQLLTGKKRIAGFNEKWRKYTYSEILKEVKRELEWNDNELYQLISVRRRSGGLFLRERLYGREIKTKNLRPAFTGDFLISKMQIVHGASGLTTAAYNNMKISGSYISLISKNNKILNIEYLNFWSKTPRFYHQTYISSYGVHIEKMTFDIETFYAQSIKLPSKLEQDSIVDILTAADKEIELAKLKLELLRSQKSGLMQQLLTGKTLVNI